MKRTKRPIAAVMAAVLTFSMSVSGILLNLSAGAATVSGIKATYYNVPSWVGDYIQDDGRGARVGYDKLNQFDATAEGMIANSRLMETLENQTKLELLNQDWYILKWTGTITAKNSGTYSLIGRKIDNGFVMKVDGEKVYEYWGGSHWFDGANDRLLTNQNTFTVEAGKSYQVEAYYLEHDGGDACEIFATTTPDDLNSGTNINDEFTWSVKREYFKANDDTGYINDMIGNGTGADGEGKGGNKGQCIEDNFKFDSSIDNLLAVATRISKPTIVSTFSNAVFGDDNYMIKYEGVMVPKTTGTYRFGATKVDNGFMMKIGDKKVYEFWAGRTWNDDGGNQYTETIDLTAGQEYTFEAWFLETNGGEALSLNASIDEGDKTGLPELFDFHVDNGVTTPDTQKYYEDAAANGSFQNNTIDINGYKQGTAVNLDYYDNHTLCSSEVTGLTPGKVYKAAYFYTLHDVVEMGWEVRFTPVDGVTLKATNGDVTNGKNGLNSQRVIVVVPFTATAATTTLKMWQHGAYKGNSAMEKFAVYGADFDFSTLGYDHVFEKAPNNVTNADGAPGVAWTPSNAPVARTPLTGSIAITGTKAEGETLTADVSGITPEGGREGLNYYWYVDGECKRGTDMFGSTYTLGAGEADKKISLKVMAGPGYSGTLSTLVPDAEDANTPKLDATTEHVLFYNDFASKDGLDIRGTAAVGNGQLTMARDGYLNLGTDVLQGSDKVTIEFVIKPHEIVEHAGIMGLGTTEDQNWWLIGMRGDGALKFGMKTTGEEAGGNDPTAKEVLKVGEWITVKYVITETSVTAFADGKKLKNWDVSAQKKLSEMTGNFVFGKQLKWPDPGFAGSLSELRITTSVKPLDKTALNKALEDAQALYDNAVVGTEPGQYPESAKTALNAAIAAVKLAMATAKDQAAVDQLVTALNEAIDTFKAAAVGDMKVYGTTLGKDTEISGHNKAIFGDSVSLDYYEKDMFSAEISGLENGKTYKALYYYTINHVNDVKDWEVKFMPWDEYYCNMQNQDLYDFNKGGTQTVIVSVPFKATGDKTKLKMWQHGGYTEWSRMDKLAIVGADFDAGKEGYSRVIEKVANAGSNKDNNKPADGSWTPSAAPVLTSDKAITSFKLGTVAGTINETTKTIKVELPEGTELKNLVPTVAVSANARYTPIDYRDYSKAVKYTVTAQDGSTAEYTVTAEIKTTPVVDKAELKKTIDTVKVENDKVSVGTNKGQVPQAAKDAMNAAITAAEGVYNNADADQTAVDKAQLDLMAAYETFQKAIITKDPEPAKSDAKDITSFKLAGKDATINGTNITVELPAGTDLKNVTAEATISAKATIDPAPATVKDFSKAVKFTVTAEDGSKKEYTVTATVKTDDKGKPAVAAEKYLVNEKEVSIGYDSKDGVVEVLPWNSLEKVNVEGGATKDASGDFVIIPKTNNGRAFWNFTTDAAAGENYNNGLVTVYKVRVVDEENALKDLSDDTVLFHFDNNYGVGDFPINFTKADYLKAPKDADGYGSFVVKMDKETLKVIKPDFDGEFTHAEGRFGGNGVVELNVSKEMTHYAIDNVEGRPLYDVQNPDSLAVGGTEPGKVDTSKLTDAIAKATELFNTAKVGANAGQYPQSAKDALDAAIKAAKAVADNKDADQKAVDDAVTALNTAVETFKAAVVKDTDEPTPPVDPSNPEEPGDEPSNPEEPGDEPSTPSTPGDNPVTGAAGIAMGTLALAAAAAVTLVVSKKRK